MSDIANKFCTVVKKSSDENDERIRIHINDKLYKKVMETLREEMKLYIGVQYLYYQDEISRRQLMLDSYEQVSSADSKGHKFTEKFLIDFNECEAKQEWDRISYTFAYHFINFTILHNYLNEEVTDVIDDEDMQIIIDYINQYHGANLNLKSSFSDIVQYAYPIFEKIKESMECYLGKMTEKCLKVDCE